MAIAKKTPSPQLLAIWRKIMCRYANAARAELAKEARAGLRYAMTGKRRG